MLPSINSYKKQFSGNCQLLTVEWVVIWAFDWYIWIELFMGFQLICHMTQNIFFNILGGYPPWGVPGCPPSAPFWFIIWKYIENQLPISFGEDMLPLKKSYKRTIFRSFPAADGQMSGQMSIQLTYLYRAFHALSIDMSHDQNMILNFGVVTPPPGGITCHPRPILVHDMKI